MWEPNTVYEWQRDFSHLRVPENLRGWRLKTNSDGTKFTCVSNPNNVGRMVVGHVSKTRNYDPHQFKEIKRRSSIPWLQEVYIGVLAVIGLIIILLFSSPVFRIILMIGVGVLFNPITMLIVIMLYQLIGEKK